MQARAPVAFFYPSRVVGGVETLFVRLAKALAERGRDAFVIDHDDGVQAKWLAGSPVRLVRHDPTKPAAVPADAVVVAPLSLYYRLLREVRLAPDLRLVLWSLAPDNASALLPPVPILRSGRRVLAAADFLLARRAVRSLADRGGLLVMDGENRLGIERHLRMSLQDPLMFPVVVPDTARRAPLRETDRLRIGLPGRLPPEKARMVAHLLRQCLAYARERNRPLDLVVIGDGPARALVEAVRPEPPLVTITLAGTIVGDALEDALAGMDLVFATGTLALESARLGVATALVDACTLPEIPPGLRHQWLQDTTEHSLGVPLFSPVPLPGRVRTEAEIIDAVWDVEGRRAMAMAARRYFETHHALEPLLLDFERILDDSRSTVSALRRAGALRSGPVRTAGRLVRRLFEGAR